MKLVIVALLALLAGAEIDETTFVIAERLLVPRDANGDGVLDGEERAALEAEVAEKHGAGGAAKLAEILTAADTDGDGRVTRKEWTALAASLGVRSAWIAKRTVMLKMADGAKLATDVYLPAVGGPFPTILYRTPYGRTKGGPGRWPERGYAVVKQDMRGRFDSEGENLPFVGCGWGEHKDGVETVAWILKQPWSNGKVGTAGGSALGITQNLLAGAAPEGLVCQHVSVAAASLYHHAVYVGGAFRKSQVEKWLEQNRFDPEALRLYRAHPSYGEFWNGFDSLSRLEKMKVPAMHVGGWFDTFSLGTVSAFVGRQTRSEEGSRGLQVLVMGPWAHGGFRENGKVGELTFPNARMPDAYSARRWFDHHMKGEENGVDDLLPVAYYVMGDTEDPKAPGNEWRFAERWPVRAELTAYNLHQSGSLSRKPASWRFRQYWFDPATPCPTVGGCNLVLPKGPMDQQEIEKRTDVLTYTTEPLEAPVEVTGHPVAKISVSCSERDSDLSVRLCDVYPDGRSFLMAEGMLRLRYRDSFTMPQPLTPHKTYEVTVPCWVTSIVINKAG